jgi:hypothetical protein
VSPGGHAQGGNARWFHGGGPVKVSPLGVLRSGSAAGHWRNHLEEGHVTGSHGGFPGLRSRGGGSLNEVP